MKRVSSFRGALAAATLALVGCGAGTQAPMAKSTPAAKVSGPAVKEGDLATVFLTADAEKRLGIRTAPAQDGKSPSLQTFAGDLMLPAGKSLTVAAPVSGTVQRSVGGNLEVGATVAKDQLLFSITPMVGLPRDLRVTAETDVQQARTRVETARLRTARADKMLKDEVGTVRAQEDARNELDLANAALSAAQARLEQIQRAPLDGDVHVAVRAPQAGLLRQILAAPGQVVAAGSALFEVADFRALWIRVPVYAGETGQLEGQTTARVETLSGVALGTARPIGAPPTADGLAATVDLYYEIANTANRFKPGEKVSVAIPTRENRRFRQVPWPAVLFDINGGSWVYEAGGDHRYTRRRVELDHTAGGIAYLRSGPPMGTPVVIEGAAELWGTEFGAGK